LSNDARSDIALHVRCALSVDAVSELGAVLIPSWAYRSNGLGKPHTDCGMCQQGGSEITGGPKVLSQPPITDGYPRKSHDSPLKMA
jgi:hypothetical protein